MFNGSVIRKPSVIIVLVVGKDRFVNVTGPTMEQITELCAGDLGEE